MTTNIDSYIAGFDLYGPTCPCCSRRSAFVCRSRQRQGQFKRDSEQRWKLGKRREVRTFPLAGFGRLFYPYICMQKSFVVVVVVVVVARNLRFSGRSHLGSLITNEKQEKAGS